MASSVFRQLFRGRASLALGRAIFPKPMQGGPVTKQVPIMQGIVQRFQGTSSKLHESPSAEAKPISRFPIPARDTLPKDVQRVMDDVEKQTGFLPNFLKVMSYDPEGFRSFMAYYNVLLSDRGNLTNLDKELITMAISTENRCVYCTVHHKTVLRLLTDDPSLADQMAVDWRLVDLDDRQRAIVELAIAVTKNEPILEEHFSNLEAHGMDQRDAFNIGHFAAFFALANRLAVFTKARPNEEFSVLD